MMGKKSELWSGMPGGTDPNGYFTYYRFGGKDNKYGTENNPAKWDPTTNNPKAGTATYNSETGSVEWNLGENFVLEDGVTYRVSFNV